MGELLKEETNEGYICLHRKARHDWKWENPKCRSAWVWLLLNAEWRLEGYNGLERGQVRFSVKQAPNIWGMSESQAKRFLKQCEDDGSIFWKRGVPGKKFYSAHELKSDRKSGRISGRISDRKAAVITILNYDKYQQLKNHDELKSELKSERISIPNSGPLTKNSSKKEEKKEKIKKERKSPYRSVEKFLADAKAIDLQPYRDKYGPKGVFVEDCLELIILHATLDEKADKHLSKKKYYSIPLTLHTYCRNDTRYKGERSNPYTQTTPSGDNGKIKAEAEAHKAEQEKTDIILKKLKTLPEDDLKTIKNTAILELEKEIGPNWSQYGKKHTLNAKMIEIYCFMNEREV